MEAPRDTAGEHQRLNAEKSGRDGIDPRGPRFSAAITSVVLAVALLAIPSSSSGSQTVAAALVVFQALVFGLATFRGLDAHLYGRIFRSVVAPRLGPPVELEDEAPPRFSQLVGFLFMVVALLGFGFGILWVAQIAIGFALAAALLNAVFNYCLGCEMYLLAARIRART